MTLVRNDGDSAAFAGPIKEAGSVCELNMQTELEAEYEEREVFRQISVATFIATFGIQTLFCMEVTKKKHYREIPWMQHIKMQSDGTPVSAAFLRMSECSQENAFFDKHAR